MERLFDLDVQLLHDAILTALALFILFLVLSYLLFNPVRDMLQKRQEKIRSDIESADKDKEEAAQLKSQYDAKLKQADAEVDEILSEARKKALANEAQIVADAKEEAARIIKQARNEAELEKQRAADEMKQEMIQIASLMAGKVVSASIDTTVQSQLVEETLNEIGGEVWQS
ncbi:MAG: F0F1 ATP synthase subunit B [Lachnospiraceae bacterium]|jgi:F-type H+-transporting ATPase subunit b|nr:F0F1 ATP synthase subunit B [Lachnospiraceae bacterium]MCR4684436.1 F0F1 ATP synthase subunit B [Lachnospiraceae bacterium]